MTAVKKLVREAALADLEALPRTWRGEIIDGTLYAFHRPRAAHARVEGRVQGDIDGPFDRGRGGPGGWWILPEPGIELPRAKEFSPDVAGWHRERLPRLPAKGAITIVPDWICEVLSKSTRSYDLVTKRNFYAQIGVGHLWYIEPLARTLTVSRLEGGRWLEIGTYGEHEKVRAEPFEAVEIDIDAWFEGIESDDEDDD
jgi:Uma2 family endonuclease